MVVSRGLGQRKRELWSDEDGVSVWEDDEVPEMDGGDRCTAVRMYLMSLNCHRKAVEMENCILYIAYHNIKKFMLNFLTFYDVQGWGA